ncbi:MAG: nucleotide exchange factor GrpE, partial [Caulobacterales bacterium]|nr:nucleotide exchange factor GrpE [Caulobacterales bacterium]
LLDKAAAQLEAEGEATERSFDELAGELDAMRDQLLRAVADADNARKIAEREVKDARAYGLTSFARDLLSVADNLGRALAAVTPDMRETMGEAGQTLLSGVELTEKELHSVFARHGVTPIEAKPGDKIDAHVHEAVARIPAEQEAGAIVEAMQPGWRIGERCLRAAMVVVSAGPPADAGGEDEDEDAGDETPADGPEPGGVVDTKV